MTNGDLKVVHCTDPDCTGGDESIVTVDGAAGNVGSHNSLALDGGGNPVISYYDDTADDLKVTHCDTPYCVPILSIDDVTVNESAGTATFTLSLGTGEPGFQMYNTPERVFYVSPNGTGDGSFDTPMNLSAATIDSRPGDLYWLLEGTYTGFFIFRQDALNDLPIVYRAYPSQHVQVIGALAVEGDCTWIWGLDISDPDQTVPQPGVDVSSTGVHVINNYIHHHLGNNGLTMWNSGPGQIAYGNVIQYNGYGTDKHPHNIYSQNDFYQYGYKYYINNIVLDSGCENCFNFHAYTEGSFITGFVLQDNIFANGRVLIGGYNVPAEQERVLNNYFFNADMQFGYRRPTQTEFIGNRLYNSELSTEWFWGAGEVQYIQTTPNVYTYNTILVPSGKHVRFRTSAYTVNGREDGVPAIQLGDIWDNNVYSAPFNAGFNAGGRCYRCEFIRMAAAYC